MDESSLKRMMPHSIEAEQSVIGALFMDNEAMSAVDTLITGEDFYQRQYGVIYEAMHELVEEGKPIDTLTLSDKLQQKDVAPEISSMAYLGEMIANVPITQNAKYYAEIVRDTAVLRRLIRASEETANKCYAGKDSLDHIMEETESSIFKVPATSMPENCALGGVNHGVSSSLATRTGAPLAAKSASTS